MLVGTCYYVLVFFSMKTVALDGAVSIAEDESSWNIYMRIGIFYDDKTTCSVRLTAEQGFDVGYNHMGRSPKTVDYIEQTEILVARHVNLKYVETKNSSGAISTRKYEKASGASDTKVGSFHIDVLSDENYKEDIALIQELFPEYNVFPAYLYQERHIFIGQFVTSEEAEAALSAIKSVLTPPAPPEPEPDTTPDPLPETTPETTPDASDDTTQGESDSTDTTEPETTTESVTEDGEVETTPDTSVSDTTPEVTATQEETTTPEATTTPKETTTPEITEEPFVSPLPIELTEAILASSVRAPLNNDMIIIDPATHNIVWLHGSTETYILLAVTAHQNDPDTKINMRCYHGSSKRVYDGYFEFQHFSPSGYFGVVTLNLVRLENYVAGVCAAEIPTWWPLETLKAFTIAVRSYAIKRLNGHGGFSGDLCNEACCQVFNGYGPTNDRVWRAALETRGVIATSNGILCGTYYSSSTGGCTANCTDVWGSSLATYPYLKAVATPWEKYTTYSRGQKTSTVTGTALYNLLENKGYTALSGAVTKIQITKTGNNTSYVTEIKFYDAKGNCQTVTRADKIKKLLSSYIDSANFVVAKSGDNVTRTKYTMLGFGATNPNPAEGVDVLSNPFLNTVTGRQQFYIITADGIKTFYDGQGEKVMTGSGVKDFDMSFALDSQIYPTTIGVNGELLPDISKLSPILESETLTTTYQADSFTFISRGWGHGVGMSQYGIYELGNLGYDYRYILKAYYSGISYTTYKEYLGK